MTDRELWEKFIAENEVMDCDYQAWAFGADADMLAELVVKGEKIATASAYVWYEIENESLPTEGLYNVVLNSKGEAVCVIQTTKVYVVPFNEVSEAHAYKEGEGDKSLTYWRKVHKEFFTNELQREGMEFREDMKIVCEEFKLVYAKTISGEEHK